MILSIVIPTFNEGEKIYQTLEKVKEHAKDTPELLVVDSGSRDNTVLKAAAAGARVVQSPRKGRAAQMNYGARQVDGEVLYFLHADSIPPRNFDQKISDALNSGSEAGCFQLAFDEDRPLLNMYAWFTRFDFDLFRFGDQSLYVAREVFEDIGGFREDHLVMEDNEIVRRLKSRYSFVVLEDKVETSARSYLEFGILKLQLLFTLIVILYHCGVDQETLAHLRNNALDWA
ncbi:MAG: TIGR04283 family arsenosugar biosynthesis glycosyltransferase [Balneolaceae bacterium]|jgi:rSAM/selenodomain-associated transferase 2